MVPGVANTKAVTCTTMSRQVEQRAEQRYSLTQSTNPHFSQRTTLQAGRSSYSGRKDTRTVGFPHRLQSPDSLRGSDRFAACRWASAIGLVLRSSDQSREPEIVPYTSGTAHRAPLVGGPQ